MSESFAVRNRDGTLDLNPHPGQWQALNSTARTVAVLAGTQGGKTCLQPVWMFQEMQRAGPGDYLVVTPTYPLLNLKLLPEFTRWFVDWLGLGTYKTTDRVLTISTRGARRIWGYEPVNAPDTRIIFGYAAEPESLESATAKAAGLDEAGQKRFKLGSYEAVRRRLSLYQGRMLITTTPYTLGWLKQLIWDRRASPDIDVIRFESIMNPAFPREEFERARRELPRWKFDMFYRAIFTRPAGLIYDSFDEVINKVPRFQVPAHWPRYLGLDFGGINTAGVFYAEEPGTGRLYLYRIYKPGRTLTAAAHAKALLTGEPGIPTCVGGSKSEGQWRSEFRAAGLPVRRPDISEVEVGIDRVWGAHNEGRLFVFEDLAGYLDEKMSYSRDVDEAGNVLETIVDKSSYHFMDAERYIIGWLRGRQAKHKEASTMRR